MSGGFANAITKTDKLKASIKGLEIAILGETNAEKLNNLILGKNGIITKLLTVYQEKLTIVTKAKGIATTEATFADKMAAVSMLLQAGASKILTGGLIGVVKGIKAVTLSIYEFLASNPLG